MSTLRASVLSPASVGADCTVLVDGSDTPITASGLAKYKPTAGDRLLVTQVGGVVEVMQFISRGTVPYIESGLLKTGEKIVSGALTGTRTEVNNSGFGAWNGATQTFSVDAATGNVIVKGTASVIGEIGTALPGNKGIFLFSQTFSQLGAMVTHPVIQFNTATTRDQPSIQADSAGGGQGLFLYSGASTAGRESQFLVDQGRIYMGIENVADDGLYNGTFMELIPAHLNIALANGAAYYLDNDSIYLTNGHTSPRASINLADTAGWMGYRADSDGSIQGLYIVPGTSWRMLTGGVFEFVNKTQTAYNGIKAESIHSTANGIFMDDLAGGGTTAARIDNNGRIIR